MTGGLILFVFRQFVQPKSVPTVGQKEIGANCPWVKPGGRGCRGKLKDNILGNDRGLYVCSYRLCVRFLYLRTSYS
jgi:hypothetical protein